MSDAPLRAIGAALRIPSDKPFWQRFEAEVRVHNITRAELGGLEEAMRYALAGGGKRVRPVLVEHCYACHSEAKKKSKGGLLLDSRAAVLKGGDTGPALVAGDPHKSLIIEAVRYKNEELQMPPDGKLSDVQVAGSVRPVTPLRLSLRYSQSGDAWSWTGWQTTDARHRIGAGIG